MKTKHKVTRRKPGRKFLGISAGSWIVIGVLLVLTLLPDFPLDVGTGLADVLFVGWNLAKQ
ncbi:MAG: hypothetical protein ABSA79_00100 [Candidatus Bathyarchaeia archaeon]